jgi:hypothetical protein
MTWWSGPDLQIKQKFNFKLEINEFVITAKSVDKPKVTVETKEFKLINHYYKYPGVVKWEPITIVIVDTMSNKRQNFMNGSEKLWDMLKESGYNVPDGSANSNEAVPELTTPAKNLFLSKTFKSNQVKIHVLNNEGETEEAWELYNPILTKIDWGSVAYGEDDATEITLTVDYDYAKLN